MPNNAQDPGGPPKEFSWLLIPLFHFLENLFWTSLVKSDNIYAFLKHTFKAHFDAVTKDTCHGARLTLISIFGWSTAYSCHFVIRIPFSKSVLIFISDLLGHDIQFLIWDYFPFDSHISNLRLFKATSALERFIKRVGFESGLNVLVIDAQFLKILVSCRFKHLRRCFNDRAILLI